MGAGGRGGDSRGSVPAVLAWWPARSASDLDVAETTGDSLRTRRAGWKAGFPRSLDGRTQAWVLARAAVLSSRRATWWRARHSRRRECGGGSAPGQRGPARRTERCSSEAVCQLCAQAGVALVRAHLGARCRFRARGRGRGRRDPVTPHRRPPAAGGPGAGHTPPGKAAGPRKVSSSLFLVSVSLQEGWVKCRRRLRSPSSPGRDAETACAITRSHVAAEWRLRGLCRGWAASLGRPGQCFLWAPLAGFTSVATVRWRVGGGCIRSGRGSLSTYSLSSSERLDRLLHTVATLFQESTP